MADLSQKVFLTFRMIKVEHSVFALPFALISLLVAARGVAPVSVLVWILLAMVSARSCAMGFNRLADRHYDRLNPRTSRWPLAAGLLSPQFVILFVLLTAGLFVFAASRLNRLALLLSPVALFIICFYSLTKRFTFLSHWFVGLALAVAPAGAWVAVVGTLDLQPLWLCLSILFWTAGFDLIYSCQDAEFDRVHNLHSVPSRFGIPTALLTSRICHVLMVLFLVAFGISVRLGVWFYGGCTLVAILLIYEQSLVSPTDLSRVNEAFFTVNGLVSVFLLIATSIDLFF